MENAELKAWALNGVLHVSGLTQGKPWYIYNLYGQLIFIGIAVDDVETQCIASLPGRGIYIIQSGGKAIKTIYQNTFIAGTGQESPCPPQHIFNHFSRGIAGLAPAFFSEN